MSRKRKSQFFTIFYPGNDPITRDSPAVYVGHDGEFVSINGATYGSEPSSAVYYDPQQLRELAAVLTEAADLFEATRANRDIVRGEAPKSSTTIQPLPAFKMGDMLRADPYAAGRDHHLVGPVVERDA